MDKIKILVIVGPTASGKTALSISCAEIMFVMRESILKIFTRVENYLYSSEVPDFILTVL